MMPITMNMQLNNNPTRGESPITTPDIEHTDLMWGLARAGSNFTAMTSLAMHCSDVFSGMVTNVAPAATRCKTAFDEWCDSILDAPSSVTDADADEDEDESYTTMAFAEMHPVASHGSWEAAARGA